MGSAEARFRLDHPYSMTAQDRLSLTAAPLTGTLKRSIAKRHEGRDVPRSRGFPIGSGTLRRTAFEGDLAPGMRL